MTDTPLPTHDPLEAHRQTLAHVEKALVAEGCQRSLITRVLNRVIYGQPEGPELVIELDDVVRLSPADRARIQEMLTRSSDVTP